MAKWIENARDIYQKVMKGTADAASFRMALEDKCDEKGYSIEETKEVIDYVTRD